MRPSRSTATREGAVQGLSGPRELGCAQRRDRGQVGACAHAFGSDQIELEAVTDELVAMPIDIDVIGVELPALGLQQRRHSAGGTGRSPSINDSVRVGGGRTRRGAGLVFVSMTMSAPMSVHP
jgi:hypothetical protein